MAVSMTGLDMPWLKKNRAPVKGRFVYDERKGKVVTAERYHRENWSKTAKKRSSLATPHFVSDIAPFVANATDKPVEISSRSQLRAYERGNGIRQCGDYKPGEIISGQNKRWQEATAISEADKAAADFKWTD